MKIRVRLFAMVSVICLGAAGVALASSGSVRAQAASEPTYPRIENPGGYRQVYIGNGNSQVWAPTVSALTGAGVIEMSVRNLRTTSIDSTRLVVRPQTNFTSPSSNFASGMAQGTDTSNWFTVAIPVSQAQASAFASVSMISIFSDSPTNSFAIGIRSLRFRTTSTGARSTWFDGTATTAVECSQSAGQMACSWVSDTPTAPPATGHPPQAIIETRQLSQTQVRFTDATPGTVSRVWTFDGGTPSSSSDASAEVAFAGGLYSVTLRVTDAAGTVRTATRTPAVCIGNIPTQCFPLASSAFTAVRTLGHA